MMNATRPITRRPRPGNQGGSILLEALIAILIFSLGILAVVGMQTTAVRAATDAKYRSDASLLANELIGQMWVTNRDGPTMKANFEAGGSGYTAWYTNNILANNLLPGVAATPPTVSVDSATGTVTIRIFWKLPSETAAAAAHNFTVVAQIRGAP